jgi:hypothetical protein
LSQLYLHISKRKITKRTENFLKFGEGSTLNNRSHTGDELQSFDVFGKHLTTSDLFQNYDGKDTCESRSFTTFEEVFSCFCFALI